MISYMLHEMTSLQYLYSVEMGQSLESVSQVDGALDVVDKAKSPSQESINICIIYFIPYKYLRHGA